MEASQAPAEENPENSAPTAAATAPAATSQVKARVQVKTALSKEREMEVKDSSTPGSLVTSPVLTTTSTAGSSEALIADKTSGLTEQQPASPLQGGPAGAEIPKGDDFFSDFLGDTATPKKSPMKSTTAARAAGKTPTPKPSAISTTQPKVTKQAAAAVAVQGGSLF